MDFPLPIQDSHGFSWTFMDFHGFCTTYPLDWGLIIGLFFEDSPGTRLEQLAHQLFHGHGGAGAGRASAGFP